MEWNIQEAGFIRDDTANHRGKDGAGAVSPPWGKIKIRSFHHVKKNQLQNELKP